MAQEKADFIEIQTPEGTQQTMPVEPENRFSASHVTISLCEVKDVDRVAEGLYACFPESWWAIKEPLELRPLEQITRQTRLAARLRPSFSCPEMKWIKATLNSTGEIIGVAGWMVPGAPVHNIWRKSAAAFYGWQDKFGWTDDEFEEWWQGPALDWDEEFEKNDGYRKELLGDEPHWYLTPLLTFPEHQGKGVGKRLLDWAIDQADATDPVTPMYLESAPTAKAVYMHVGFVEQSAGYNFLRRGPLVAKETSKDKAEKLQVKVEEKKSAEV
ncbi:hypothetical protein K504DRAFT_460751 [Pleomassaria siparia CBS 279.74]|uniref:N-acetyltransferase domain-containing protein n=1 Tax=Pleomassaria siparia CBS 279.74 TaxID=1314801 RepID=A0A6G1JX96_9PLEO|nr:hypothetical protein K504DRAFT_460751 [Pleomassaria siparia CBS 279.74]